jgi:anaerobic ribonucleoside-triphosphate reductase activating protein
MEKLVVDEVNVTIEGFDPSIEEIRKYIKSAREDCSGAIAEIKCTLDKDGMVDIDYREIDKPFERVRRITGYLSTLDRYNDAKRAEVSDRVIHE